VKPGKLSYTVREATEVSGIPRTTLWRLTRAGRLQVSQIGSRVYILAASLQELLEQGRKEFIAGQK
jgi:excisionase family DNA binding protein